MSEPASVWIRRVIDNNVKLGKEDVEAVYEELLTLENALMKVHEAMTNYHCETFLNFPDEAVCGASKRPCKRYFLCEAMKEALAVGNEEGGKDK